MILMLLCKIHVLNKVDLTWEMPNYSRNKNISRSDQFRAFMVYLRRILTSHIRATIVYRRIYRNYIEVILHVLRNEYPIEAIYRNGVSTQLHNRSETSLVTWLAANGIKEYEIANDKVKISSVEFEKNNKIKLELYDAVSNGDLLGIFFHKIYDFLPVDGKTVIDIGANIGDSCIYFALRRASKIIAIEPFPRSYTAAEKNIEVNGLTNKITLQLAGCNGSGGAVNVDPFYESGGRSALIDFKQGRKIPLLTLRNILIQNNVRRGEAVLKMDCEGCEYDTILSSSADTLRFFSHIQVEYHRGYKNLKEKLEKCGFHVSVTRPLLEKSSPSEGQKMVYTGYLYAIKEQED
jgi:FkbM family methyltransferase